MFTDFVLNGEGYGEVGSVLNQVRFDPGLLRPYLDEQNRHVCDVQTGWVQNTQTGQYVPKTRKVLVAELARRGVMSPVYNAQTLTKQAWVEIDRTVVKATRQRLRAWTDLAASSTRGGFNAFAKATFEYQVMTDPMEAVVDMDAITDGRRDRPLFKTRSVPLPITHSDFWYSEREIAISRSGGQPLDTTGAEAAARRCAETVEQTLIGTITGITGGTRSGDASVAHEGTSTVYGYTNFPYRITKTDLTTPTGSNPEAVKQDVIEMRELLYAQGFYGPFMVYTSTGYDAWLDDDYFRTGSTAIQRTLRERIESIDGVAGVRRLDYLTSGYQIVMVQMSPEVAQAIDGMDWTVVRWETKGGAQQNFRVMGIKVPLLKAPYNGVAGMVHATTS